MGESRAVFEAKRRKTGDPLAASNNPAFAAALRAPEEQDHPSFAGQNAPEEDKAAMEHPMSPEEVTTPPNPTP